MNKIRLIAVLLGIGIAPSLVFGQHYRMDIDLQDAGQERIIDRVFTGNTVGLRASFYDATEPFAMTNWTVSFNYGYGQYDTNGMVPIAGVASSNVVVFESLTNLFFAPGENYYFSIAGVDAAGRIRTFATGRMIEEYDPATGSVFKSISNGVYFVSWGNISGDPANNAALTNYISQFAGADSLARAGVASNAASIVAVGAVASNALPASATNGWEVGSHAGLLTKNEAAETYQPTGSYLTAETDPDFSAWEPTAHVPVICSGGWLYPDYFTLQTYPYAEEGISYGETSEYNSVLFTWQTLATEQGVVLSPHIIHQVEWTSEVAYAVSANLEIAAGDGGISYAEWAVGTASGEVGQVTAILGGYRKDIDLEYSGDGVSSSNAWWVADLPGSLRAAINESASNLAWAADVEASIFSPYPYSTTNFIRNPDCWAASIDLTCASPWNSYRFSVVADGATNWHNAAGNYHAGTAITPQHFLYATHFSTWTNTVFRWIDATNGIWDRTLVAQRFLGNDIALGLLDSPLPESIVPAKSLSEDDIGCLRGKYNLRNAPGVRVVCLDSAEYAWQAKTPMMETMDGQTFSDSFFVAGSTNEPFSRRGAIAGDSGNPIFLVVGTNTLLLSTFWTPNGGPMLPKFRSIIDAAMIEMGRSIYTNWATADLSAWTNYDHGMDIPDF